jgi:hypothetical protein
MLWRELDARQLAYLTDADHDDLVAVEVRRGACTENFES